MAKDLNGNGVIEQWEKDAAAGSTSGGLEGAAARNAERNKASASKKTKSPSAATEGHSQQEENEKLENDKNKEYEKKLNALASQASDSWVGTDGKIHKNTLGYTPFMPGSDTIEKSLQNGTFQQKAEENYNQKKEEYEINKSPLGLTKEQFKKSKHNLNDVIKEADKQGWDWERTKNYLSSLDPNWEKNSETEALWQNTFGLKEANAAHKKESAEWKAEREAGKEAVAKKKEAYKKSKEDEEKYIEDSTKGMTEDEKRAWMKDYRKGLNVYQKLGMSPLEAEELEMAREDMMAAGEKGSRPKGVLEGAKIAEEKGAEEEARLSNARQTLRMSPEEYQDSDKTAEDIINACREVGLSRTDAINKLKELSGGEGISEAGKKAIKDIYAGTPKYQREDPLDKVPTVSVRNGKVGANDNQSSTQSSGGSGYAGAGGGSGNGKSNKTSGGSGSGYSDIPVPPANKAPVTHSDEEVIANLNNVVKVKQEIEDLNRQIANEPDGRRKQELQMQLRDAQGRLKTVADYLSLDTDTILNYGKEGKEVEDAVKSNHENEGWLTHAWSRKSKKVKQQIEDVNKQIKEAKKAGEDTSKLEKRLEDLKDEKSDINSKYGYFLFDAIKTGLGNMAIPGAYGRGPGNKQSLWDKEVNTNLDADLNRHNKAKDATVQEMIDGLAKRHGADAEQVKAANDLLNNEAAVRQASRLGILESMDKLDAAISMKNRLGIQDWPSAIMVMTMMGYNPTAAAMTTGVNKLWDFFQDKKSEHDKKQKDSRY